MNATPHAHRLEVDTRSTIYTYLRYGDQTRMVDPDYPFYGLRIRRNMRSIVKKHDRASKKAGRQVLKVQKVRKKVPEFDLNQWGSKQRLR